MFTTQEIKNNTIVNVSQDNTVTITVTNLLEAGPVDLVVLNNGKQVIEKTPAPPSDYIPQEVVSLLTEFGIPTSELPPATPSKGVSAANFSSKYDFTDNTITSLFNGAVHGTPRAIGPQLQERAGNINKIVQTILNA